MIPFDEPWELLVRGVLGPGDDESVARLRKLIHSRSVDWVRVIRLADTRFVTAALWSGLVDQGLADELPADVRQYLSAVHGMNEARNAGLSHQFDELVAALNARGIVPVAFKGIAHLRTGLYPDPSARILTDIDLLVRDHEIDPAAETLAALDYRKSERWAGEYDRHHHLAPYFRPGDYGVIEVHREPLWEGARAYLTAAALWEGSSERTDGSLVFRTPSPTHSVLLAIVHSEVVDRHLRRLDVDLRALADVAALCRRCPKDIDWPAVLEPAGRLGDRAVFEDFLYLLQALTGLDTEVPLRQPGLRSRARYVACRAALRSGLVRRLQERIERVTSRHRLRKYGYIHQ